MNFILSKYETRKGKDLIKINVIEDITALNIICPIWNRLLEESRTKSIFLTWEWIETWWNTYQADFDLLVLLAYYNDVPCGIAPLVVRKGQSPRLEFFGQNKAYGEYLDFIIRHDLEYEVAPALCNKIIELGTLGKWQCISFAAIPEESPNLSLIYRTFSQQGIHIQLSPPRVCRYIMMPSSWEEYLELKGKKLRKHVEYNERRLSRSGEIRIEFPRDESEINIFFYEFAFLHNHRWRTPMDSVFFEFHRQIAHQFFSLNRLILTRLCVGKTVVATKYDFIFDNKVWGYQGGWLRDYKDREVGTQMLCEVFKYSIGCGLREYDFLEGDSWYKQRWSTSFYNTFDLSYNSEEPAYIF
jgi:CelD/BcsL family acetyltransferase involved in cellulose biosynthesis